MSESKTFEEHAETVVKAAIDLHHQYGLDLTEVTLYPSKELAGSWLYYVDGFYAADGRGRGGYILIRADRRIGCSARQRTVVH